MYGMVLIAHKIRATNSDIDNIGDLLASKSCSEKGQIIAHDGVHSSLPFQDPLRTLY